VSFRNSWWPRRREITKDWKQVQQRSRCGNRRREEYGKSDIRRNEKRETSPGGIESKKAAAKRKKAGRKECAEDCGGEK
jgi:hypothetical protein